MDMDKLVHGCKCGWLDEDFYENAFSSIKLIDFEYMQIYYNFVSVELVMQSILVYSSFKLIDFIC